jgi:hypothetical protein
MMIRLIPSVLCGLVLVSPSRAQAPESRFSFHGYSTINYFHYNWQTDPARRDAVDLERVALEFDYRLSPRIVVNSEIEFEHGGTGSAMEYEGTEEFGEFEAEIEKGGEVKIEELSVSFLLHPSFNVKVGHFFVPIGFAAALDEPTDYFTVERGEAERALLPVLWDETGAEIFGDLPGVRYQLQVVNGLDATGFTSGNWIAPGHQGRFETVNAENWAMAARVDARGIPFTRLGVSGYVGNSRDNRPKPDLNAPALVTVLSAHAQGGLGPWLVRGVVIWSGLTNSEAVTRANANLPNSYPAEGSPVAAQAYAAYAEAGVDVLALAGVRRQSGFLFGRIDAYDTMWRTQGQVLNNPYWERRTLTGGVHYKPNRQLVLKGQYAHRVNGNDQSEDTFSLGLGVVVF